jgi:hypothetical protein
VQCLQKFREDLRRSQESQSSDESSESSDEPHQSTDSLGIAKEIELLIEVEDIADELHIIKQVLEDQDKVMMQMHDIITKAETHTEHNRSDDTLRAKNKVLGNQLFRVDQMEKLAQKTHDSVRWTRRRTWKCPN